VNRSIILSSVLHVFVIILTAMSLPFLAKKPIDLPPIVSVELIQITEKTNIPFAPKARKIIEENKKKEERLVSEQAPPAAKAKEKPDRIPLPNEKKEEKQIIKKKQNNEQ
jgi:outer membrane biosynthesis protein TonB